MTQDEIIEMAKQAAKGKPFFGFFPQLDIGLLEAFAKLVAAKKDAEHKEAMRWDVHTCGPTCKRYACVAIREAVKAEREACAKVVESFGKYESDIAEAIRARGEA